MYGMAAQSADPNSVFFRMKNALQANGDDEEAEYQQFMEAQAFNVHSMRLMTGQDTIIMDKDVINPEMTQVMSYIADPTLFVPFGGLAAKGASMVGMGEKLAMAAARTQGIRNLVLGGAIKWGVGAPLEFMGGAIRNTIDYGIDTGSRVFETATGVAAKDIASATRVGTLGTAAGSVAGLEVNSSLGAVSRYYAGSLVARNVGEAAGIYGEQMMKQGKTGRGVLGYAGQAIRDSERAGIKLAPHTKSLLKAIEAVDPLFVYADDIASGAAQGAMIGGGLGYLAGGEEGFAGGVGSGMALGTVGATAGKVVSDVTGNTKIDQMRIQRKLVIEALKENGNENAVGFEAMAAMAEATGDRAFMGYIDGIIAGIDTVNPDAVFKAYNKVQYDTHLKSKGIDPNTGVLLEKSRIFPELNDRTVKADVLGILRDTGGNFAGDPAGFEQAVKSNPAYAKVKPIWNRLDDNAKQVILKQIKDNGDPTFTKSLKGRQLNAHWSDMAYAEKATEIVNTLNQKNANSVPAKVADLLKAETRSDKKLTRRGQMLKEKLQADGYIDKDGNVRTSRLKDVEGTQGEFEASAGWAKSRDSTGRTEVIINLDKWAMDSGNRLSLAHELYHSIMLDSVFAPDYIDRLSQKLLGKFDPKTGRVLEQALVQPDELMKFFGKYIENDPSNRGDAETIKRKKEELKKSIEDYRTRGTANRVADATAIPLEHLVEEFGAYYFSKWVKAQPIDYMFRGGEFGGIRGLMEMASDGWLDYWKGKVNEKNPQFNFDGMGVSSVSKAFEKDGKRVSSRSLDLFMRDIVRIEANRNSNNGFDVNKLSKESREWFLKVNGLRGAAFGQLDQQGNVKKPKLRRYTAEEIRQGKEMFKVLESLPDAAHKDGMRRDGDGNWSGQPNTAQINALVGAGYIQRAWFDRMARAYDIVNGNGSNVVEFGYLGYSAHIGDGNERVYGAAVPFKNRRAVLIGVDFKVRADGTVYSNLHTLDLKVIEARGNEVWKDPQTRELWKGSRTDMEADFYAYLSNASLPSDHPNRKPSAKILDKGDGLGGQRRDALHQMLGFHKGSDLPYINRPIAEIPVGIRHSVTTFSNDGIVNMRVDNKPRYDFNFENAHLDLSRNFMPDEMRQETTPSGGKIIKHATGYQISKQAGTKFKVFDPEGKHLGDFDTVADAGRAAQKHFNESYDKSVEGKDAPVPPTEVPPSRQGYIDRTLDIKNNKEFLESIKNGLIEKKNKNKLNKNAQDAVDNALLMLEREGLSQSFIKVYNSLEFDYQKNYRLLAEHIANEKSRLGREYDAMYPMEIKSALHPRLAQIFQDYPNLTAQGLLKKLVVYGSQGSRMFQEATEIGLIDLLKSKTKSKTEINRVFDLQKQEFTGEVRTSERQVSVQTPFTPSEIQEVLDFAKSKEIKVTIEEGARERSGMDTSRYTLGGAKDNYKETAVRINPEYAHGISGHYGKDTIVHFRTTERIDADGNRHLFIEEVQANNTDIKSGLSQQEIKEIEIDRDVHLPIYREILAEGKKQGRYVSNEADGYTSQKEGVIAYVTGYDLWDRQSTADDITDGMALDWSYRLHEIGSNNIAEWWIKNTVPKALKQLYHEIERGYYEKGKYENTTAHFFDVLKKEMRVDKRGEHKADYIQFCKDISETAEVQKLIDLVSNDAVLEEKWRKYLYNVDQVKNQGYITYQQYAERPDRLLERISDVETSVQQLNNQKVLKPLPLTSAKDWTLTALKGIIRQGIRDGLDKITLTHPDDSPTVSHMKGDARKGLYGKLIPEVWGSWLRKYGIEMKQTNKLADATIDTAKGQMAEITNKLHDANKAVLEHFEQVKGGEDPATINNLAQLMATPVHKVDDGIGTQITIDALKINDNKLQSLIGEVALLKKSEYEAYTRVNKLREGGIRADSILKSDTAAGISAEAIDRGMTFELNDRIKRDFLDGKIQTHAMPAESGADSVKTKNKITLDANGLLSKLGMNLKDKTKMEIWMRHLTDDPATALEFIREEGLVDWMKNRAQSVIDAEVESWDAGYKELKHQQKVAQQFLDKVESEKIDKPKFQPAEYQGGDDYYKPKKNPFESKDEQGFLIREWYKKEDNGTTTENPNALHWMDIGHGRDDKKSGIWYLDQDSNKIEKEKVSVYNDHDQWFNDMDKQFSVRGRIEFAGHRDRYGKIIERPRISIMKRSVYDFFSDRELDYEFTRKNLAELKKKIAKSYGLNPEDVDAYYFGGDKDVKNSFGLSEKDQLPVKFQPAEGEQGGRVYTDKQMSSEFIGRYAAENKIFGLKINVTKNRTAGGRSVGDNRIVVQVTKGNSIVGSMNIEQFGTTSAVIDYAEIKREFQGRGFGNLIYSEAIERLRSLGVKDVSGMVIDNNDRPIQIRKTIIDSENQRVGGEPTSIDATRLDEEGNKQTDVTSYLEPKAWYQPDENPKSYVPKTERAKELFEIIKSVPHYKEAFESGQLTIDAYKTEDFKEFHILSHAPDTASTVDGKYFKGQGGIGYPLLFKGEGWAAVSRGLEKRINAIGEKNRAKNNGKFLAPVALVMSHAEKIKSAINGTNAFVNVIKALNDKKIITNEVLRLALIKGLKNAGVNYITDSNLLADALWRTKTKFLKLEGSGFNARAKFVKDVAGAIAKESENLTPKQMKILKEIIPDYEGSNRLTSKHLVPSIFSMFEDPMLKGVDAPDKKTGGTVYGFVLFDKPLVESKESPHGSYKYSVKHEDNSPVRVDILSNPVHTMDMFSKAVTKKGEVPLEMKTVVNKTGQRNFPYGDVKHHMPTEYSEFKSEQSATGRILRNAKGYVIMLANNKFRVYNPAKAIIGVYSNEEEAKKRIYKEIPKR